MKDRFFRMLPLKRGGENYYYWSYNFCSTRNPTCYSVPLSEFVNFYYFASANCSGNPESSRETKTKSIIINIKQSIRPVGRLFVARILKYPKTGKFKLAARLVDRISVDVTWLVFSPVRVLRCCRFSGRLRIVFATWRAIYDQRWQLHYTPSTDYVF